MIFKLLESTCFIPIRFPKIVVACSVLLTVAALVFIPRLYVTTDRNVLLGTENPIYEQRQKVNAMFGTPLVGIVIVQGTDSREDVLNAADEIAAALTIHEDKIGGVFHRADVEFFKSKGLLYLNKEQLKKTRGFLERINGPLDVLAQDGNMAELVVAFSEMMQEAGPEESDSGGTQNKALESFGDYLDVIVQWFSTPASDNEDLKAELAKSVMGGGMQFDSQGYLTDNDGENPPLAILFVQPASTSQSIDVVGPFTDLVRQEVEGITSKYEGMSSYMTGPPAMARDEMRIIRRDSVLAGLVAAIGVMLVFMFAFRSWRIGVFLIFPLGFGIIWTAGLAAIIYGYLTMLTAYFAAILFGLGVAFTIHIVARYLEALRDGETIEGAVQISLVKSGPAVVVGGVTTAMAFLAIIFSDFKGFAEMGVISGVGIALILISNLTTLPAMLVLWHPGVDALSPEPKGRNSGAFWITMARSTYVLPALAVVAAVAGVLAAPHIKFDYALENLLPSSAESVRGLEVLNERTDYTSAYSVAVADSIEEAEELRLKLESLPTVARAEALSLYFPTNQKERLVEIGKFSSEIRQQIDGALGALESDGPKTNGLDNQTLALAFQELGDTFEDLAFDAKRAGREENKSLSLLAAKSRGIEKAILKAGSDDRARDFEEGIFSLLEEGLRLLQTGFGAKEFFVSDLPASMQRRFISKDRRHFAIVVFPTGELGDGEFLENHVNDLLSVSPRVTGHPIGNHHFATMTQNGFKNAVILAAIAVIFLVLLDVRRPLGLALSLLPVVFSAGWAALIMYLTDFKLNHGNLMGLPILIGTAVDYGVHLAHRAKQAGSVVVAAKTTGKAIALSGLTTLIGFGSLTLSVHWGMRSLGLLLVIGIGSALVLTLVVFPGLFRKH